MSLLRDVIGTWLGYFLYFAAMILTAAQLAVVYRLIKVRKAWHRVLPASIHFLVLFFFLTVLLDYSYNVMQLGIPESVNLMEAKLLSLPWLLYAGLELASVAAVILNVRAFRLYRDTHLDANAIRHTVDTLPTGIVIGDEDGTVLLSNLRMTGLCRSLTGELLNDTERFWKAIERACFREHLFRIPDGDIWQFARSRITLEGAEYVQITASDMTELYSVTEELTEKNRHLKEVQEHIRSVAAKERDLASAREVMNARMTVHDRMGAVLLSGKYYLDHPENVKEDELLRMLEYGGGFLLGEAEQPEEDKDLLQEAVRTAHRIGVETEISGSLPENKAARDLLAQAIEQCAANTVRHAGGDRLRVTLLPDSAGMTAALSNNGKAPDTPIRETGGLAVLRKSVEAAGGIMTVQSDPAFLLTVFIPEQE